MSAYATLAHRLNEEIFLREFPLASLFQLDFSSMMNIALAHFSSHRQINADGNDHGWCEQC